ncbi:Glycosyl transferase, group 1 [Fulvivirga imtechensis AK7]|uniref:Glycosyl transferase, group 1 n=1 Tax=Fulvivirga imtechensis AK7 TaxID=1237149 RepID=L8JXF1_9BACT|nr:glycosyltransferase [Fulvivirga imtechensis]ELR72289.1 Glycosyl transferase, group 1 [Fulvivirga imtechensis AK7]
MKKIKILYGLESTSGGSLKHLLYLTSFIDPQIFDITVVLSSKRGVDLSHAVKEINAAGAKLLFLPMKRSIDPLNDAINLLKVKTIIREGRYDIVHAHSSKAGVLFRIAARMHRVPLILYTPHCFYFQAHEGLKKKFFVWIEYCLAKMTDYIIVSRNEKSASLEEGICPPKKLININNAIKFNEKARKQNIFELKKKYNIKTTWVVGSVGRLTKQKDWFTFIYAARHVLMRNPDVSFIIAGTGEQKTELEGLIASLELEDKVMLLGYIEDIDQIYSILDVFVSSSLWEGLPYAYLEAMHHRKPVIATYLGENDLLQDDETGYIIPKKDYKLLSHRICKLLKNKEKIVKLGMNGKSRITEYNYSFERFIEAHKALYTCTKITNF